MAEEYFRNLAVNYYKFLSKTVIYINLSKKKYVSIFKQPGKGLKPGPENPDEGSVNKTLIIENQFVEINTELCTEVSQIPKYLAKVLKIDWR